MSAVQETRAQSLGQEDPLEKEMVTHSSILSWNVPWTEDPGWLQSMVVIRVGHNFATKAPHDERHAESMCYFQLDMQS